MHLEATWGAPIADHRAQAGLIGKLASLLINLASQLTRGPHDERLWVGFPVASLGPSIILWSAAPQFQPCQ